MLNVCWLQKRVFALIPFLIYLIIAGECVGFAKDERFKFVDEIQCFCDLISCPGSSTCTGKWCLIGVNTDGGNGRLEQVCGWDERDRPMDCAENWDKWTEVCACDQPLCNTFAFLRSNMDKNSRDSDIYSPSDRRQSVHGPTKTRGWYHGGNLIILLVILPLSVGGLAVCLTFVNYHCRLT